MEIVVGLAILGGGAALVQALWRRHRAARSSMRLRSSAAAAAVRRRHAEERRREQLAQRQRQVASRNAQLAMLQLRQSPDFRRAASFAAAAQDVPIDFRQRQFRRLRPLLVNHLVEQLRKGVGADVAAAGLAELVSGLGIADYEADYIIRDATARTTQRPVAQPTPRFEDEVQRLQVEHEQRMATLRDLALEGELKEQLLEQEETRFRDRLLTTSQPSENSDRIRL